MATLRRLLILPSVTYSNTILDMDVNGTRGLVFTCFGLKKTRSFSIKDL